MIDPLALVPEQLLAFDATMVEGDFDIDEPCEIEKTHITPEAMAYLSRVAFAADSCVFENCDLSVADLVGVRNCRFVSCKLRGTCFSKFVRNVVFDRCQLVECLFRMMILDTVVFQDCDLNSNDFYESTLDDVAMPSTVFAGVGFDKCTLRNVDLSGASDLQVGDPRTLVGATLRETQVPLIAARLAELHGIVLTDG